MSGPDDPPRGPGDDASATPDDAPREPHARHGRGELGAARPGDDDLPVVARLVVEIRSDGRRTVARGGLEDAASGQRVTIDARGDSPAALALALARSLLDVPRMAARLAARGVLGGRGVRGLLGRGKR